MQAVLKGLHSTDIADVETYLPDKEDNIRIRSSSDDRATG
jgi:hypothetical protein